MRTFLLTAAAVLVILPMAAAFFLEEKQPAIYEDRAGTFFCQNGGQQ